MYPCLCKDEGSHISDLGEKNFNKRNHDAGKQRKKRNEFGTAMQ